MWFLTAHVCCTIILTIQYIEGKSKISPYYHLLCSVSNMPIMLAKHIHICIQRNIYKCIKSTQSSRSLTHLYRQEYWMKQQSYINTQRYTRTHSYTYICVRIYVHLRAKTPEFVHRVTHLPLLVVASTGFISRPGWKSVLTLLSIVVRHTHGPVYYPTRMRRLCTLNTKCRIVG